MFLICLLGHGVCDTVAKSETLPAVTDDKYVIAKEICTIFRMINPDVEDMRGVRIPMNS